MTELLGTSEDSLEVQGASPEAEVLFGAFLQRGNCVGFAYLDNSCILHIMYDIENFPVKLFPKSTFGFN